MVSVEDENLETMYFKKEDLKNLLLCDLQHKNRVAGVVLTSAVDSNFFFAGGKKSSRRSTQTAWPFFLLRVSFPRSRTLLAPRQFVQFSAKMFKASPPMMARLRFTTKQVGGGFYKGTRTGAMGRFEKQGKYSIDWAKVRTYVAPDDLEDFDVRTISRNCPS